MKKDEYIPHANRHRCTRDQRDFLRRRTVGFLRDASHVSLGHLLEEVYLQGMRDAVDVMNDPNGTD